VGEFVLRTIYRRLTKSEVEAGMKSCFGEFHLREGWITPGSHADIVMQGWALKELNFPFVVGEYRGEFQ
jgi:hypothetical protein